MAKSYYPCSQCGTSIAVLGRNRADADGLARWRESQGGLCDDCREEDRRKAAETASQKNGAAGWAALVGTEKQIQWAEQIRRQRIDMLMQMRPLVTAVLERDSDAQCAAIAALSQSDRLILPTLAQGMVETVGTLSRFDALVERLMHEDSASWWIDSRGSAFTLLFGRFRSDIIAAEADAACPDLAAAVAAEALLRPAEAHSTFIADARLAGHRIEVRLPARDDVFANTMRQQGLSWGGTCWRRPLTEQDGQPAHRLAEIAHAILAAGFPVRVQDAAARALAVSGDFTPGHRRWVSVVRAGKFNGWCRITWRRPDDLYKAARSLPGSRYADGAVVVPADAVDAVLDFAATYGFGVSRDVQVLAAAHRASLESGAVVEHARKPASEAVRSHGMPHLHPNEDAAIDESLRDD